MSWRKNADIREEMGNLERDTMKKYMFAGLLAVMVMASGEMKAQESLIEIVTNANAERTDEQKIEALKQALSNGAAINEKYGCGWTAFLQAVAGGYIEIAKFLLQQGAELYVKDNSDNNALLYTAYCCGGSGALEFLIKRGLDVNSQNFYGFTALHYAIKYQRWGSAKTLIENKADVNKKDKKGNTPLHFAAKLEDEGEYAEGLEHVKLLVDNGAKINEKNNKGQTALDIANLKKRLKIATYLKE